MVPELREGVRAVHSQLRRGRYIANTTSEEASLYSSINHNADAAIHERSEFMTNLERWANSAGGVASTTSILASPTDPVASDLYSIGESLRENQRVFVNDWILRYSTNFETNESVLSSDVTSNLLSHSSGVTVSSVVESVFYDRSGDDAELSLDEEKFYIDLLVHDSAEKERMGDDLGAEEHLREAIDWLEKQSRKGRVAFKNTAEMWEALALLLCKQDKLDQAATILEKYENVPTSLLGRRLTLKHELAERYVMRGELGRAEKLCMSARIGRREEHGEESSEFKDSVVLCHKIWQLLGKESLAKTLKHRWPGAFDRSSMSDSPLDEASNESQPSVASSVIESSSELSVRPAEVDWSDLDKRRRLIELLDQHGIDLQSPGRDLTQAVQRAVTKDSVELVRFLLDENRGNEGASALEAATIITAATLGKTRLMNILLKMNVDINARDSKGFTPLHRAAGKGHETTVQLLLERGANVLATNSQNYTALHSAMLQNICPSIVPMLIEHGVDLNATQRPEKRTALHIAAAKGRQSYIPVLLEGGANLEARDHNSQTPLHLAIANLHEEVAEILLVYGAGADIEATDSTGRTPLHHAIEMKNLDMVKLLLRHEAVVDSSTRDRAKASSREVGKCIAKTLEKRQKAETRAKVSSRGSSGSFRPPSLFSRRSVN